MTIKRPDQPNEEAFDATSRQTTLADVLNDPTFDQVNVSARWSEADQTIIVSVRAARKLTNAEFITLVERIKFAPNEAASKVMEDFEATLDQPIYSTGVSTVFARDIEVNLAPVKPLD